MRAPGRPIRHAAAARPLGVASAALALSPLVAPAPAASQWHIGVQSGITYSTLTGSFVDRADPVLGGTVAIAVERWLGRGWVIDLDAGLVQRGAAGLPVGSDVVDFRLVYLEAPLTVSRMFPILGGGWRLGPYAGLAVGWLSACGVRFEGQWRYMDCLEDRPGGEAARLDPSLPLGITLRHRYRGGSRITVDLRYSYSLGSVLTPGDAAARSHLFQALFGFVLPLGEAEP